MTDIKTLPIPTEVLVPANYPEFIGPATDWQASATHLQARPVGGSTWVDVVALSEITGPTGAAGADGEDGAPGTPGVDGEDGADAVLTPIPSYTETGATLTFVAEASGDIEIPCDGKVYQLTITGDCSLVTGTVPTAPECAVATVAILIDIAAELLIDPEYVPVIAVDATWHWTDSTAVDLPTADESKAVLTLQTYPQGWVEAHVRTIGVPA